jgi:alpha-beta hydrolase superfamily lysophospholipase
LLVCALAMFVALNLIAYRHAWKMTHYAEQGVRTVSPDKLTTLKKLSVLVTGVTIPRPESLPAVDDEHVVTLLTADGLKLEAWDIPATEQRGVVLMFHGYAVSKSAMQPEAALFRELGMRTVMVDFRGSGGSDGDATTLGWSESADVLAAVNWARNKWPDQRLIVYGQSLGAAAILRAVATEELNLDGMILESPYDTLLTTVGNRYHTMRLPAFPFAHLLVFWGGVQHGFNAFRLNPVAYAPHVKCPALVIGGEHDPWAQPDEVRRVASALGGTTECHIFEHAGHGGYGQNENGRYRDIVGNWLDALLSSHDQRGSRADASESVFEK